MGDCPDLTFSLLAKVFDFGARSENKEFTTYFYFYLSFIFLTARDLLLYVLTQMRNYMISYEFKKKLKRWRGEEWPTPPARVYAWGT